MKIAGFDLTMNAMTAMPRSACTNEGNHSGSLATDPSFVNIDITGLRYLTHMVRPAQTARSERTREALRQRRGGAVPRAGRRGDVGRADRGRCRGVAADLLSPLRVEARSAVRRLRRRPALVPQRRWRSARPTSRSSSRCRRRSWPARTTTGPSPRSPSLRAQELDPGRIVRHIRQVEADFAEAIEEHLARRRPAEGRAPTSGCASRSPRAASPPRCSARWRCGCSATTGRCPS